MTPQPQRKNDECRKCGKTIDTNISRVHCPDCVMDAIDRKHQERIADIRQDMERQTRDLINDENRRYFAEIEDFQSKRTTE